MTSAPRILWSVPGLVVFWWVLFLVTPQAERLALLPEAASIEPPTGILLAKTLIAGFSNDLVVATGGTITAAVLAVLFSIPFAVRSRRSGETGWRRHYRGGLVVSFSLVGVFFLGFLAADMSYYGFNHQHLNFVFFEFVGDIFEPEMKTSQAAQQATAELSDGKKWAMRVLGYLIEGAVITAWWLGFRRTIGPMLIRWEVRHPLTTYAVLMATLLGGPIGLRPPDIRTNSVLHISSDVYDTLAQSPIVSAGKSFRAGFVPLWSWAPSRAHTAMTADDALQVTRAVVGRGATFPYQQYPLVRETVSRGRVQFERPLNVLLILVEGLDRRYLGQTIQVGEGSAGDGPAAGDARPTPGRGIRVTPFLDRLKDDSLYFENFFTNGAQTSRGIITTFCSYYPGEGAAAIKTRATHDYLCLPALLRNGGYRTEMVVGQQRTINNLQTFLERNGLDRLYDVEDFQPQAERLGLGVTDAAILDLLRARIEALRGTRQPFFLATLTLSTHHPFLFPAGHPEVRALRSQPDQYVAALRYFDVEFERFFTGLQRDGLLKNTMVVVLGDHGRHEAIGQTDVERQAGHFLSPLFIWLDHSVRTPQTYRPRPVTTVASQVDLAPTILALNRLTPRVSPFVGRDLSCLLVRDCEHDNLAYLSSVWEDVIGLADQQGIWLYSFQRDRLVRTDLRLQGPAVQLTVTDPDVAPQYRRLLALYLTSNMLLERNAIWSWKELSGKL